MPTVHFLTLQIVHPIRVIDPEVRAVQAGVQVIVRLDHPGQVGVLDQCDHPVLHVALLEDHPEVRDQVQAGQEGEINFMRKVLFIVLALLSVSAFAQQGPFGYYQDALIFSQSNTSFGSTARIQAIGGAQVALGGDLSSIASNPAGLGFFNRSVFTITPSLNFSTTDTRFSVPNQSVVGTTEEAFKNNFNFANIGTVFNFTKGDYTNDKFKGGSLGISLSRQNSFHLERSYEGANDFSSVLDSFLDNAGQTLPDDLGGHLQGAYDQYLINPTFDTNDNFNGYDSFVLGYPIQDESIRESGSHYSLNIAWGGNYDDRLYFGGGMGVQIINYKQRRDYLEYDFVVFDTEGEGTPDEFLNSISIYDELDLSGAGINFNFGAIYRPINFLTLGVNYTSPSFISFNEESFFDLGADWRAGTTITETDEEGNDVTTSISSIAPFQSDLFVSEYNLRTPSRLGLGATLFVGKNGFLTGDLEFIDYTTASINSNDFSEAADNNTIDELYTSVMNVRVGGEYRFDRFRLRAGYAIYPSPYEDSDLQDRTNVTFGFGYRTPDYFLDFALVNQETTLLYSPYDVAENQTEARSDIKNTAVSVTFGLNF